MKEAARESCWKKLVEEATGGSSFSKLLQENDRGRCWRKLLEEAAEEN